MEIRAIKYTAMAALLAFTVAGCQLAGWYECSSLSGWCKLRKPAAIDFWDIGGESPPSLEDYEIPLSDGNRSVRANEYESAQQSYFYRKIRKFEACGLDWRTRDGKPLIETFKQEGFDCLKK
ncbi:TPA: RNA-binding protein [Neisseria meningitidis]